MALIVEDGTNVAGADSYTNVADCEAFILSYYGENMSGSPTSKEAALRRAASYMNSLPWKGTKQYGRAQSLAWPRSGVVDIEGLAVDPDSIPTDVIQAQHILARAEFSSSGALSPTIDRTSVVKKESIDGAVMVEYDTSLVTGDSQDSRPVVTAAMDLIKGYLAEDIYNSTATRIPRMIWAG